MKKIIRQVLMKILQYIDFITLKKGKLDQLRRFNKYISDDLQKDAKDLNIYNNYRNNLVHKTWENFSNNIIEQFINKPTVRFFSVPVLMETMTGLTFNHPHEEFLQSISQNTFGMSLEDVLKEDVIGGPVLLRTASQQTSLNRIVHVYQFSLIGSLFKTKEDLRENTIVEWGGGFGGLARIFNRIIPGITYIIIDIPAVCLLQTAYLTATLGSNNVNLIKEGGCFRKGCVNILPNQMANDFLFNDDKVIFISSWAISESSKESQELVLNKRLYNANSCLIIHQPKSNRHPYSEYMAESVPKIFKSTLKSSFPYWTDQTIILASNN